MSNHVDLNPPALWSRAKQSQLGVAILTNDRQLLREQLYRVRANSGHVFWEDLVITFPANEKELWIVHKDVS